MTQNAILRLPQVKQLTGLSRSTIYLRIKTGQFSRPISLGGRAVGWLSSDVEAFIQACVQESRKANEVRV